MLKKLRDVKWGWQEDHIGKVVQRYKNSLIPICKQSGEGWTDIFLSWPHGFTAFGYHGVDWDIVLDELVSDLKTESEWKKIIVTKVRLYGGWVRKNK